MTIELQDLIGLFGDAGRRDAIDQLVERYERALQSIDQLEAELDTIDTELTQLGVGFVSDDDDASEEYEEPEADEAPTRAPRPRRKPALPGDAPGDIRSTDEYVNALDEVGHELRMHGGAEIRGADIANAMAKRGFPSRPRVMAYVRAHPNWHGVGDKRARFCYEAAPRATSAAESAAT